MNYHWELCPRKLEAKKSQQGKAVPQSVGRVPVESKVKNKEIRNSGSCRLKRFGAIGCRHHVITTISQGAFQKLENHWIVFDYEDGRLAHPPLG